MFAILPVFCLFPPPRSLVPGYFVAVVAAQRERGRGHERPGASENKVMKSYGNLKIKRPDLATNWYFDSGARLSLDQTLKSGQNTIMPFKWTSLQFSLWTLSWRHEFLLTSNQATARAWRFVSLVTLIITLRAREQILFSHKISTGRKTLQMMFYDNEDAT